MEIKVEKKKTTRGRQRIEMKKIEKRSQLQVTFSKRRAGLFKKAGELSVLCGVDVAVIAVSPAGKVFSFGSPSADAVVDRFLDRDSSEDDGGRVGRLREREREKATAEGGGGEGGFWWDRPVGELGLGELERYMAALEELACKVKSRADELAAAAVAEAMENGFSENFLDYGSDTGGSTVDPFCGREIIWRWRVVRRRISWITAVTLAVQWLILFVGLRKIIWRWRMVCRRISWITAATLVVQWLILFVGLRKIIWRWRIVLQRISWVTATLAVQWLILFVGPKKIILILVVIIRVFSLKP